MHLAQQDLRDSGLDEGDIVPIAYRPFDTRYTYYTGHSKGFHRMPRGQVMQHFVRGGNLGLVIPRQTKDVLGGWVVDTIAGHKVFSAYDINTIFPLYLYPDGHSPRRPNLDPVLAGELERRTGLAWQPEAEGSKGLTPLAILDYIYAVLYSPACRHCYAEFLKSDFPRIPWPGDGDIFQQLASLGGRLRRVHLLEEDEVDAFITTCPQAGDDRVTRGAAKNDYEITDAQARGGRVWINETQYFDGVPQAVWDFYLGGYQPARKWLKDRKGKTMSFDDIRHYQHIIKALDLTSRIMGRIHALAFLPG